jgi:transcriptional regulator with XRE-family HTH domain
MFRLTVERERRGWSKSELSRRSGVGLVEISRLEAGKIYPYPGWRQKLASALDCSQDVLFEKIEEVQ